MLRCFYTKFREAVKMRNRNIIHESKNRLEDLRVDRDLKQEDVAKVLNIHQTTLSKYEKSTSINIPLDILCKLADFYETSTDYILLRTDEIKPYPPKNN
jgi:transcriptional regulator with XRE-family HTH domain